MKKTCYFLLSLWCFPCLLTAQTIVRFLPSTSLRNTQGHISQVGKIEQIGNSFAGKVHFELPDKTLDLNLRPSRLKQYLTIITSTGEQPSRVELLEDINEQGHYFLAVIDKQVYSLLMLEKGNEFSLEKTKTSEFAYQKIEPNDSLIHSMPDDYSLSTINKANNSTTHARSNALGGCYEFSIGFVCDYAQYLRFVRLDNDVSAIEADNLMKLADTQELYSDGTFAADIHFRAIGQIIYNTPDNGPWPYDTSLPLNALFGPLYYLNVPESWAKYKFVIRVGITGLDFISKFPNSTDYWGFAQPGVIEDPANPLGRCVFKGYFNKGLTKVLFAHELGHLFGALHDTGIMNSTVFEFVTDWSKGNKDSINHMLNRLDDRKQLIACPSVIASWAMQKDSLTFAWEANYDSVGDSFTLESSADEQKTWNTVTQINSTGAYRYQYKVLGKVSNKQLYYRVRQTGAAQSVSNLLTVALITAVEETATEGVSAYPNPFTNQLLINVLSPTTINIYSISGKLQQSIHTTEKQLLVDTKSWAAGTYFIQMDTASEKIFRVVKQ